MPALAIAACAVAAALVWSGTAEAKTGLLPVVVEGSGDRDLALAVEEAIVERLSLLGPNPPPPAKLPRLIRDACAAEPFNTGACALAGNGRHLDLLLLVRVEGPDGSGRARIYLRAVVTETGAHRRFVMETTEKRLPRAAARLVEKALSAIPVRNRELEDVKRAAGVGNASEYSEYIEMGPDRPGTFAEFMYDKTDKRRRNDKAIAIALPSVLAIPLAALIYAAAAKPWEHKDKEGDVGAGENVAGGFGDLFTSFGVGLAIALCSAGIVAALLGGIIGYSSAKLDLELLRPLVPNPPEREEPEMQLSFAPWLSPGNGGLALDLRF